MDALLLDWPWVGLVLALLLLGWSVREARAPEDGPRWSDPVFLLPLLWPMYLVHQFEEHGVDFHGEHYAFLAAMCRTVGHAEVAGCPADEAFIFAVNVIACPLAFVLPYAFRRTRPLLAAIPWGVPLVNAVSHVAAAVREGAYNPGLVTSLLLFVPLTLWVLRALVRRGVIRVAQVGWVVGTGVLIHVVLLGSVQLRARGWLGPTGLFVVNALNGLVPLALGFWPSRPSAAPRALET